MGMHQSLPIEDRISREIFNFNVKDLLTLLRDQTGTVLISVDHSFCSEELWELHPCGCRLTCLRFRTVNSGEFSINHLLPDDLLNLSEKEPSNSLCLFSPLEFLTKYIVRISEDHRTLAACTDSSYLISHTNSIVAFQQVYKTDLFDQPY